MIDFPIRHEPRRLTEDDLIIAHSALVARPCACGGVAIADPRDPAPGVREHQDNEIHREWVERWLG